MVVADFHRYKSAVLVFLMGCVTLVTFLGYTEYYTKGEPREAIVAVTMLDSGNWILPTNNGGDMAYKPPFFHWCIAAVSKIAGGVTEFTSRVPSAVALILMTTATFVFYRKRRGECLAMLTALLLLTNFEVHRAGVACRVDMVLTACIVGAMYSLYRWYEKDFKGFPIVGVLLMSGAVLTKGPVGMVLPCLVMGVFMLVRGKGFWKSLLLMSMAGVASLVLPSLWYYAAYQQGGQQFIDLVMEENFGRFTGTMSYDSHVNPWYYNVITLVSGFTPYTILALMCLSIVKRKKISVASMSFAKIKQSIAKIDDARLYSLLAIIVVFVFYCIPKSKRSVYLLPMYPCIAYFMAELIAYVAKSYPKLIDVFLHIMGRAYELLFIVFISIRLCHTSIALSPSMQLYVDAIGAAHVNVLQMIAMALPILLYEMRNRLYQLYEPMKMLLAPLVVMSVFLALDSTYQPIVLNAKADRATTDKVLSMVPKGPIYSFVDIEMMRFFVINFYSGNRVVLFENSNPNDGYILLRQRDACKFMARHSDYTFEQVYKSKYKGCDVRDYVLLCKFTRRNRLSEKSPQ